MIMKSKRWHYKNLIFNPKANRVFFEPNTTTTIRAKTFIGEKKSAASAAHPIQRHLAFFHGIPLFIITQSVKLFSHCKVEHIFGVQHDHFYYLELGTPFFYGGGLLMGTFLTQSLFLF